MSNSQEQIHSSYSQEPNDNLMADLLKESTGLKAGSKDSPSNSSPEQSQQPPFTPNGKDFFKQEDQECLPQPEQYDEDVGDGSIHLISNEKNTSLMYVAPFRKDSKCDKISYLSETRSMKIDRYLRKKSRRIWNRTVSYQCRRQVAVQRVRIKGQFAKNNCILASKISNELVETNNNQKDILQSLFD